LCKIATTLLCKSIIDNNLSSGITDKVKGFISKLSSNNYTQPSVYVLEVVYVPVKDVSGVGATGVGATGTEADVPCATSLLGGIRFFSDSSRLLR
jgi:hypothetical protein